MNEDILELPWIGGIEIGVDQIISTILQRIPVSIVTLNRANILMLNLKATLEVHLVSLDQSSLWVLNRPDHTSNDRRSHLKSSSVLIGSSFTGRFDI